jgi:hypothetical protein
LAGTGVLPADEGKRAPAGALVTETGTLLRREAPGKPWQVVSQKGQVSTGETLIGFPGAQFDSVRGAVRLTFLTDLDGDSPYPIAESAVSLRPSTNFDMDLALDRGRIDVANRKASGPARVRVYVRNDAFELTLAEPGSSVALELYGRWPAGARFVREPKPTDVPTADLVVLVRQGAVNLKHGAFEFAMRAPPGPALIEWDSVTGLDAAPRRLDKLPPWADQTPDTPEGKAKKAVLDRFRQAIVAKSVDGALDEFLGSENPSERRLAVRAMGALDDIPRLGKALREAKHPDVWDAGVLALRQWIGRGPGQDQRLYQGMIETGRFSPVEAETVLQLLHSFGETDLARPETYETLIAYLDHDQLAVRGLAYWHLIRLVPQGKSIGYNPMDDKAKRDRAVAEWKKLVPSGKVPRRARTGEAG